jgi:hypothetical protein|tara:strand:+ start:197 stop:427 length:231 start_codon:yes stop_codon:yes gene_type:complete
MPLSRVLLKSQRKATMILSQASNLQTRQRVWIGRKSDLGPQIGYGDQPTQLETEWIAGVYAEKYEAEAKAKIPCFE